MNKKPNLFLIINLCLLVALGFNFTKNLVKKRGQNTKVILSDSFSYAIGINYAKYIKAQGIILHPNDVARGMKDFLNGHKLLLDSLQINTIINRMARESIQLNVNKQKAEFKKFLENNKHNPAIHEIIPGMLQYEILQDSTGIKPVANSKVTVKYIGRLLNGAIFDQTDGDQTISFNLNQVIKGWRESLIHMPKGSIWRIYMASDLAYGDHGTGNIPGGSGLIFDITLVDVES